MAQPGKVNSISPTSPLVSFLALYFTESEMCLTRQTTFTIRSPVGKEYKKEEGVGGHAPSELAPPTLPADPGVAPQKDLYVFTKMYAQKPLIAQYTSSRFITYPDRGIR
jgi:hypothetical protein